MYKITVEIENINFNKRKFEERLLEGLMSKEPIREYQKEE